MKIDILTLFPQIFDGFKTESIIKRAIEKNLVEVNIINFRNFSPLNNQQVDDTPYGGGSGMVLRCEPIFNAIKELKTLDTKVILMTPEGQTHNQKIAKELSKEKHIIFICGHYEGFDERIKTLVDMQISIGDFILTGGELPAMMISDSIIRLLDGVINEDSLKSESFEENLLDYPTYTKPAIYDGLEVPKVLMSGNHQEIAKWRQEQRIIKTKNYRPDIMK